MQGDQAATAAGSPVSAPPIQISPEIHAQAHENAKAGGREYHEIRDYPEEIQAAIIGEAANKKKYPFGSPPYGFEDIEIDDPEDVSAATYDIRRVSPTDIGWDEDPEKVLEQKKRAEPKKIRKRVFASLEPDGREVTILGERAKAEYAEKAYGKTDKNKFPEFAKLSAEAQYDLLGGSEKDRKVPSAAAISEIEESFAKSMDEAYKRAGREASEKGGFFGRALRSGRVAYAFAQQGVRSEADEWIERAFIHDPEAREKRAMERQKNYQRREDYNRFHIDPTREDRPFAEKAFLTSEQSIAPTLISTGTGVIAGAAGLAPGAAAMVVGTPPMAAMFHQARVQSIARELMDTQEQRRRRAFAQGMSEDDIAFPKKLTYYQAERKAREASLWATAGEVGFEHLATPVAAFGGRQLKRMYEAGKAVKAAKIAATSGTAIAGVAASLSGTGGLTGWQLARSAAIKGGTAYVGTSLAEGSEEIPQYFMDPWARKGAGLNVESKDWAASNALEAGAIGVVGTGLTLGPFVGGSSAAMEYHTQRQMNQFSSQMARAAPVIASAPTPGSVGPSAPAPSGPAGPAPAGPTGPIVGAAPAPAAVPVATPAPASIAGDLKQNKDRFVTDNGSDPAVVNAYDEAIAAAEAYENKAATTGAVYKDELDAFVEKQDALDKALNEWSDKQVAAAKTPPPPAQKTPAPAAAATPSATPAPASQTGTVGPSAKQLKPYENVATQQEWADAVRRAPRRRVSADPANRLTTPDLPVLDVNAPAGTRYVNSLGEIGTFTSDPINQTTGARTVMLDSGKISSWMPFIGAAYNPADVAPYIQAKPASSTVATPVSSTQATTAAQPGEVTPEEVAAEAEKIKKDVIDKTDLGKKSAGVNTKAKFKRDDKGKVVDVEVDLAEQVRDTMVSALDGTLGRTLAAFKLIHERNGQKVSIDVDTPATSQESLDRKTPDPHVTYHHNTKTGDLKSTTVHLPNPQVVAAKIVKQGEGGGAMQPTEQYAALFYSDEVMGKKMEEEGQHASFVWAMWEAYQQLAQEEKAATPFMRKDGHTGPTYFDSAMARLGKAISENDEATRALMNDQGGGWSALRLAGQSGRSPEGGPRGAIRKGVEAARMMLQTIVTGKFTEGSAIDNLLQNYAKSKDRKRWEAVKRIADAVIASARNWYRKIHKDPVISTFVKNAARVFQKAVRLAEGRVSPATPQTPQQPSATPAEEAAPTRGPPTESEQNKVEREKREIIEEDFGELASRDPAEVLAEAESLLNRGKEALGPEPTTAADRLGRLPISEDVDSFASAMILWKSATDKAKSGEGDAKKRENAVLAAARALSVSGERLAWRIRQKENSAANAADLADAKRAGYAEWKLGKETSPVEGPEIPVSGQSSGNVRGRAVKPLSLADENATIVSAQEVSYRYDGIDDDLAQRAFKAHEHAIKTLQTGKSDLAPAEAVVREASEYMEDVAEPYQDEEIEEQKKASNDYLASNASELAEESNRFRDLEKKIEGELGEPEELGAPWIPADKAIKEYRSAVNERKPEPVILQKRDAARLAIGELERAVAEYEKSSGKSPAAAVAAPAPIAALPAKQQPAIAGFEKHLAGRGEGVANAFAEVDRLAKAGDEMVLPRAVRNLGLAVMSEDNAKGDSEHESARAFGMDLAAHLSGILGKNVEIIVPRLSQVPNRNTMSFSPGQTLTNIDGWGYAVNGKVIKKAEVRTAQDQLVPTPSLLSGPSPRLLPRIYDEFKGVWSDEVEQKIIDVDRLIRSQSVKRDDIVAAIGALGAAIMRDQNIAGRGPDQITRNLASLIGREVSLAKKGLFKNDEVKVVVPRIGEISRAEDVSPGNVKVEAVLGWGVKSGYKTHLKAKVTERAEEAKDQESYKSPSGLATQDEVERYERLAAGAKDVTLTRLPEAEEKGEEGPLRAAGETYEDRIDDDLAPFLRLYDAEAFNDLVEGRITEAKYARALAVRDNLRAHEKLEEWNKANPDKAAKIAEMKMAVEARGRSVQEKAEIEAKTERFFGEFDKDLIDEPDHDAAGPFSFGPDGKVLGPDRWGYGEEAYYSPSGRAAEDARHAQLAAKDRAGTITDEEFDEVEGMVLERAKDSGLPILDDRDKTSYKIRRRPPPKKTKIGYMLRKGSPLKKHGKGGVKPLYVGATETWPIGVWLDMTEGEEAPPTKTGSRQVTAPKFGSLRYRPGAHIGDIPLATHIGKEVPGGHVRRFNEVWVEVEYSADIDYQEEADTGEQGLERLPVDGTYKFKTQESMTGYWNIAGSIKINRILSEEEANEIVRDAGFQIMPWERGKLDLGKLGLTAGPTVNRGKLLDPFTYDENGALIPLSERFNAGSDDIFYSAGGTPTWQSTEAREHVLNLARTELARLQGLKVMKPTTHQRIPSVMHTFLLSYAEGESKSMLASAKKALEAIDWYGSGNTRGTGSAVTLTEFATKLGEERISRKRTFFLDGMDSSIALAYLVDFAQDGLAHYKNSRTQGSKVAKQDLRALMREAITGLAYLGTFSGQVGAGFGWIRKRNMGKDAMYDRAIGQILKARRAKFIQKVGKFSTATFGRMMDELNSRYAGMALDTPAIVGIVRKAVLRFGSNKPGDHTIVATIDKMIESGEIMEAISRAIGEETTGFDVFAASKLGNVKEVGDTIRKNVGGTIKAVINRSVPHDPNAEKWLEKIVREQTEKAIGDAIGVKPASLVRMTTEEMLVMVAANNGAYVAFANAIGPAVETYLSTHPVASITSTAGIGATITDAITNDKFPESVIKRVSADAIETMRDRMRSILKNVRGVGSAGTTLGRSDLNRVLDGIAEYVRDVVRGTSIRAAISAADTDAVANEIRDSAERIAIQRRNEFVESSPGVRKSLTVIRAGIAKFVSEYYGAVSAAGGSVHRGILDQAQEKAEDLYNSLGDLLELYDYERTALRAGFMDAFGKYQKEYVEEMMDAIVAAHGDMQAEAANLATARSNLETAKANLKAAKGAPAATIATLKSDVDTAQNEFDAAYVEFKKKRQEYLKAMSEAKLNTHKSLEGNLVKKARTFFQMGAFTEQDFYNAIKDEYGEGMPDFGGPEMVELREMIDEAVNTTPKDLRDWRMMRIETKMEGFQKFSAQDVGLLIFFTNIFSAFATVLINAPIGGMAGLVAEEVTSIALALRDLGGALITNWREVPKHLGRALALTKTALMPIPFSHGMRSGAKEALDALTTGMAPAAMIDVYNAKASLFAAATWQRHPIVKSLGYLFGYVSRMLTAGDAMIGGGAEEFRYRDLGFGPPTKDQKRKAKEAAKRYFLTEKRDPTPLEVMAAERYFLREIRWNELDPPLKAAIKSMADVRGETEMEFIASDAKYHFRLKALGMVPLDVAHEHRFDTRNFVYGFFQLLDNFARENIFIGRPLTPVPRLMANIISDMLRLSPFGLLYNAIKLGIVRPAARLMQGRSAEESGEWVKGVDERTLMKNVIGFALFMPLMAWMASKMFEKRNPDEPEEDEPFGKGWIHISGPGIKSKSRGITRYAQFPRGAISVRINGKWQHFDYRIGLWPFAIGLSTIGTMQDAIESKRYDQDIDENGNIKKHSNLEYLAEWLAHVGSSMLFGATRGVLDNTMFSNYEKMSRAAQAENPEALVEVLTQMFRPFVAPNVLYELDKSIFPSQRSGKGPIQAFLSNMPLLRHLAPKDVGIFGGDVKPQGYPVIRRGWIPGVDEKTGKISYDVDDPELLAEMYRRNIPVFSPRDDVELWGIPLSEEKNRKFLQTQGSLYKGMIIRAISEGDFDGKSARAKLEISRAAYMKSRDYAKEQAVKNTPGAEARRAELEFEREMRAIETEEAKGNLDKYMEELTGRR